MKKSILTSVALATAIALAGCGTGDEDKKTVEKASAEEHYPLTIENFAKDEGGTEWKSKDQEFKKAPERVMANTRPAAELMLHLGLKDKIAGVGANFGEPDPTVASDYKDLNILSDSYVGKEVTLGVNPDLVYGRGGLFDNAEWGVGTVDSLNELGINTYVLESSIRGGTYDSIYKDIENTGKIFNVKDKADSFIKELKSKESNIENKLSSIKENRSFAYLHMSDPDKISIYPAGDETFMNDVFNKVKLDNVFKNEKGEVSVEMLIDTDPDVLIVPKLNEKGGDKSGKIIKSLLSNPKLSSMKAVKNKTIYAVDYNYLFGYSYTAIDGIELLAKEMYPELFK